MSEYTEYEDSNGLYEDDYEDAEEPRSFRHNLKVLAATAGIIALTASAAFIGYGESEARGIVSQQSTENIPTFEEHYDKNIIKTNAYVKSMQVGTEKQSIQPLIAWNINTANIYLSPTGLISKIQKEKLENSAQHMYTMQFAAHFKSELDNFCLVAKTIEDDKDPMRSYTIVENTLEKLVTAEGKKDQEAWNNSAVRLGLPANFFSTKNFMKTLADESNASNYTQYCYVKRENQAKMEEFLASSIQATEAPVKVKK